MGCRLLILDEDTCASNFMIRDSRMRSMIAHEPITPFIYRVNSLWNQLGISTVVVIGGSGDWFDVHDTVILLDNYLCKDMTKKAYSISKQFCTGRVTFNGRGLVHQLPWPCPAHCRVLTKKSCDQMMKRLISSKHFSYTFCFADVEAAPHYFLRIKSSQVCKRRDCFSGIDN